MNVHSCSKNELQHLYKLNRSIYGDGCYPLFVLTQYHDLFSDLILLAEVDGRYAGFSINGLSRSGRTGWILSLGTHVEYRKQGVAGALVERTVSMFKEMGVEEIKLTVRPTNPAVQFYERMGFEQAGDAQGEYGDGEARVKMRLNL